MTSIDKQRLMESASILRVESRNYYDTYKHNNDSKNATLYNQSLLAYEKYQQLNRIAAELDIIAGGNL